MRKQFLVDAACWPGSLMLVVILGAQAGVAQEHPQRLPAICNVSEIERLHRPDSTALHSKPQVRLAEFVQPSQGNVEELPAQLMPLGEPVPARPATSSLTLQDLEMMAITCNPSIARAAALVDAAQGNFVQVGLAPNPSVGYEGQQIGSGGLAEQDGVWVSQEFVRGGKLKLNREVAAHEMARAQQNLAAQQQRVLTDVRMIYHQVLIAQQQELLTSELVRIANEAVQVAEGLVAGKEVGRVDLVQAKLELDNAEIVAQNARQRHLAAWQSLTAVVGQPELVLQPVEGDVEGQRCVLTWEGSLQHLQMNSPEVAAAMSNVERARWAVQRAAVEHTPNVSVQALYNWRDEGIGGKPDGSLTVGIPLPIWNRNQGGIMQAQSEVVAAERELQQLELSLQNRLAPVFERYENARRQVNRYRERSLPAAKELHSLSRQLYEGGETNYINLLTAQRTYSQASLNYLDALRELRTAEAEIEGLLLSGSLENR